jgi:hypothetical protein
LAGAISNTYQNAANRDDVEVSDEKVKEERLPVKGMQVHNEYTMVGHFFMLKDLMQNVNKWRFFVDQESGIRSAILYTFREEIKQRFCEAFYVKIDKGLTVDQKRIVKAEADKRFKAMENQFPSETPHDIQLRILKDEIAKAQQYGKWKDRWVKHPSPTMSEPEKAACWMTEHNDFDQDHVAMLYNKASMHSVDVFFEKVRRRMSMTERASHSASTSGRTWHGYSAYDPGQVVKLLEIFRVVHNYIDARKIKDEEAIKAKEERKRLLKDDEKPMRGKIMKNETPAMRMGLAKAKLDYDDILRHK